jgi:hypothetical protein
MLKFSKSNSKMTKLASMLGLKNSQVFSFDLPAGWTCPMADICLSKADRVTGKITDGENSKFRCYAASLESAFTTARNAHWHNFDLLKSAKTLDGMVDLILSSLPSTAKIVRIHSSGDFFNRAYFQAWVKVAIARPDVMFFGYTKILNYVSFPKPSNFKLVYSMGGKMDKKVTREPYSMVVNTIKDAVKLGLEVSCQIHPADDYNFVVAQKPFALVLHGTQPKGGAKI